MRETLRWYHLQILQICHWEQRSDNRRGWQCVSVQAWPANLAPKGSINIYSIPPSKYSCPPECTSWVQPPVTPSNCQMWRSCVQYSNHGTRHDRLALGSALFKIWKLIEKKVGNRQKTWHIMYAFIIARICACSARASMVQNTKCEY